MSNLDVAFIEGAASSSSQEEEMKKIRENAKYVVANRRLRLYRHAIGQQE